MEDDKGMGRWQAVEVLMYILFGMDYHYGQIYNQSLSIHLGQEHTDFNDSVVTRGCLWKQDSDWDVYICCEWEMKSELREFAVFSSLDEPICSDREDNFWSDTHYDINFHSEYLGGSWIHRPWIDIWVHTVRAKTYKWNPLKLCAPNPKLERGILYEKHL